MEQQAVYDHICNSLKDAGVGRRSVIGALRKWLQVEQVSDEMRWRLAEQLYMFSEEAPSGFLNVVLNESFASLRVDCFHEHLTLAELLSVINERSPQLRVLNLFDAKIDGRLAANNEVLELVQVWLPSVTELTVDSTQPQLKFVNS